MITRRTSLGLLSAGLVLSVLPAHSTAAPLVQVFKDPSCGCCDAWVDHLARAGFRTQITETAEVSAIKTRHALPETLWSCHTALVEDYVIEGHVPAQALVRLLSERPSALGLAVPGMPVNSPGMEVSGAASENYTVILIGKDGRQRDFMQFRGTQPL